MRVVIQKVKRADVQVNGEIISSIGPGLLCLVGIKDTDTTSDAEILCKKILKTRAFGGGALGKNWDQDVTMGRKEILLVSQFTLYARLKKPKPDFSKAMTTEQAREFYSSFIHMVRKNYEADLVKDGAFGAMMEVSLTNDGPTTFVFDTEVDV